MKHIRTAVIPLLALAIHSPGPGRSDVILAQNSQYTGQYTGQYSGQSSGQWSGQPTARWSGQYLGQKAPPPVITLSPGPVDNRGDPNASVDGRDLNTFPTPDTTTPSYTSPCWSVLTGTSC